MKQGAIARRVGCSSIGAIALVALGLGCGDAPPVDAAGATASATGPGGDGGAAGALATGGASSSSTAVGGSGGSAPIVPYPIPDWPTGSPEDQGLDGAALAAAAQIAESDGSYCLLVIRHGVLVAESYWNGTDATTKSPSWSIAKSYASVLVGIALDRGEIESLDQSVADYVPDWKGTEREAITIRHLLSMTSGLQWSAFQDYVTMAALTADQTAFAEGLPLAVPPGSEWTYHNGGVQLLEPVLRAATGMSIEAYAEQHLWSKIGTTASWEHDGAGDPTAYANVLASCRDHARLGYLYLHGGAWAGQAIVPSSYVAESLTPSQTMNRAYGYLWWLNGGEPAVDAMGEAWPTTMVPFAPDDLFAARGFGNQFIDVVPSLDMIVVRFGADPLGSFDIAQLTTDSRFEEHDAIVAPIFAGVLE